MKGLSHRGPPGTVRDARFIALALEGERTGEEYRYFSRIRALLVNNRRFIVELLPTPAQTHQSSPNAVIDRLDEYVRANDLSPEVDELWLVFDVDSWPEAMLSRVTRLASQKRYRLAASNPCFELWLILHFRDPQGDALAWSSNPSKRSRQAKQFLSQCRAGEPSTRDPIPSALPHAVARAEQFLQQFTPAGQRWPSLPGTYVHEIITHLRDAQLLPLG